MRTYTRVLQGSLLVIIVMLVLNGCLKSTFTELEDNKYSIVDYPDFPLMAGDDWMLGRGTAFEARRQNIIKRAEEYCGKYGKVAAIESIEAVPPFHEGDSGVLVTFSCFSDSSVD